VVYGSSAWQYGNAPESVSYLDDMTLTRVTIKVVEGECCVGFSLVDWSSVKIGVYTTHACFVHEALAKLL
jgi:alpha-D-ribose 1-methylphosphonate 5-triphosphate synthase subunit PhnG